MCDIINIGMKGVSQMYKYFLYRYIDDTTKEIVYIGKTQQLDVINRIDQHKTDNVGKWTQNNKFHIEFISVPREEDMNYIESFLIRKFQPKLNIVLSNNDKPAFNIYIPENLWINLDDYLTQKAEINEKPKTIISENITKIAQANSEFKLNVNKFIESLSIEDKNFVKRIFVIHPINVKVIESNSDDFNSVYGDSCVINDIANRLVSYNISSKIYGKKDTVDVIGLFDSYTIDNTENRCIFILNPYFRSIIEKL